MALAVDSDRASQGGAGRRTPRPGRGHPRPSPRFAQPAVVDAPSLPARRHRAAADPWCCRPPRASALPALPRPYRLLATAQTRPATERRSLSSSQMADRWPSAIASWTFVGRARLLRPSTSRPRAALGGVRRVSSRDLPVARQLKRNARCARRGRSATVFWPISSEIAGPPHPQTRPPPRRTASCIRRSPSSGHDHHWSRGNRAAAAVAGGGAPARLPQRCAARLADAGAAAPLPLRACRARSGALLRADALAAAGVAGQPLPAARLVGGYTTEVAPPEVASMLMACREDLAHEWWDELKVLRTQRGARRPPDECPPRRRDESRSVARCPAEVRFRRYGRRRRGRATGRRRRREHAADFSARGSVGGFFVGGGGAGLGRIRGRSRVTPSCS